jgi:hypothetical protein
MVILRSTNADKRQNGEYDDDQTHQIDHRIHGISPFDATTQMTAPRSARRQWNKQKKMRRQIADALERCKSRLKS